MKSGNKNRCGKDEDGVTHVIEFLIAFSLFLLILASFTSSMDHHFTIKNQEDVHLTSQLNLVSRALIFEEGVISSPGKTGSTEWETYPHNGKINPEENLIRLGFSAKDRPKGTISTKKLEGLNNITYTKLKSIFNLEYDINLTIRDVETDDAIISIGKIFEKRDVLGNLIRFAALFDERTGNFSLVELHLRMFRPGELHEKLIINEIMVEPAGGLGAEWVEIYNPGDLAVNISGWEIGDYRIDGRITDAGKDENKAVLIPGKGYAVVCANISSVKKGFNTSGVNLLTLMEKETITEDGLGSRETIVLKDSYGQSSDFVSYDGDWEIKKGVSLQKKEPLGDDNIKNWCADEKTLHTIGRENSCFIV